MESKIRPDLSISRSQDLTRRWTKWVLPVVAIAILLALARWAGKTVEQSVKGKLAEELKTILNADIAALTTWLNNHESNARLMAERPEVKLAVDDLLMIDREQPADVDRLKESDSHTALNELFVPLFDQLGCNGFAIFNGSGKILTAFRPEFIGQRLSGKDLQYVANAMDGETVISHPFPSQAPLPGPDGKPQIGMPTMFVTSPVKDSDGNPIAVLGLRIQPEKGFTSILRVARSGVTGETYAFDAEGLLLSESRFVDQLEEIGLVEEDDNSRAILNVFIRDPGVNLVRGRRPKKSRDEQPLTEMAASAVAAGKRGDESIFVNVDGYNDYRGVQVVGAWTWLPHYSFGVATEADVDEAYAPLIRLRTIVWSLFGLVVIGTTAVLVFLRTTAAMQSRIRRAERRVEKLGQYRLEKKIGEGGMGEVYCASHAMLRRPTAVKLLRPERSSEKAILRFEREVQSTSQLTHPNTIVIFDYGRTPEGVFYYAMEFLDGIDLNEVIGLDGPQPAGRVIHLLQQACGSLAEAHQIGLVHRDIKPANIMLCNRGGQPDVVKVLDFGLVKDVASREAVEVTQVGAYTGTPLYMSPEAADGSNDTDARSDIYAIGAVGYFLLTGQHVFDGTSPLQILQHHVRTTPELPSVRLRESISNDLEQVIMRCLEKNPADRPQTADELADLLLSCRDADSWSRQDAHNWWQRCKSDGVRGSSIGRADTPGVHDQTIDVDSATR